MSTAAFNKLPPLTVSFWILTICATTLGETGGDLLAQTLNLGYAYGSAIFGGFFLLAFSLQRTVDRYRPIVYWLAIVSTGTAGTTISDMMDRTLGLGYAKGSIILAMMLVVVLSSWRVVEKSISVAAVDSKRSETFYWIAILVSNTLGTALGDFLAERSGLGFCGGAIVTGGGLLLIIALHYATNISGIILFWAAFVLTRPFGATFGDLLTKPVGAGGLDFGTTHASLLLGSAMALLVLREMRWTNQNQEQKGQ